LLNVVCVNWRNYQGMGEQYVLKLRKGCAKHLKTPHTFHCLTDEVIDTVNCHMLPTGLDGWWNKLALFRPGFLPGQKVYFDLDVVLLQDFEIPECGTKLLALNDFSYPLEGKHRRAMSQAEIDLIGGPGTINSSVMTWADDHCSEVWTTYSPKAAEGLHGDQNWITKVLYRQDKIGFLEGIATSHRYGNGEKRPVKVYHGKEKPHMTSKEWRAL